MFSFQKCPVKLAKFFSFDSIDKQLFKNTFNSKLVSTRSGLKKPNYVLINQIIVLGFPLETVCSKFRIA